MRGGCCGSGKEIALVSGNLLLMREERQRCLEGMEEVEAPVGSRLEGPAGSNSSSEAKA